VREPVRPVAFRSQIKNHPCFFGKNGANLYFPATPATSSALAYMKSNPIKARAASAGLSECVLSARCRAV
jgi:hypothetical protein